MHLTLIIQFLAILTAANGTPVVAKGLLGDFLNGPLDRGMLLADGQPLFGRSKTIRGIVLSLVVTTLIAPIIGLEWKIGLLAASAAMLGDLVSSFTKRRLGMPASSRATGLDQIPESLLPALACSPMLGLSFVDICVVVAAFFIGEIVLSLMLFKWHLRDRPF